MLITLDMRLMFLSLYLIKRPNNPLKPNAGIRLVGCIRMKKVSWEDKHFS